MQYEDKKLATVGLSSCFVNSAILKKEYFNLPLFMMNHPHFHPKLIHNNCGSTIAGWDVSWPWPTASLDLFYSWFPINTRQSISSGQVPLSKVFFDILLPGFMRSASANTTGHSQQGLIGPSPCSTCPNQQQRQMQRHIHCSYHKFITTVTIKHVCSFHFRSQ